VQAATSAKGVAQSNNIVQETSLSPGVAPSHAPMSPTRPAGPPRMVAMAAVNVHALPGSAVKLFPLQRGDSVEVIGKQGQWVKVQGPLGPSGWVFSSYLEPDTTQ
jgi:SH3-like domain-containing protein